MQTAETAGAPDKASLAAALRELEAARMRVERDARNVSDDMRKQLVERLLPVLDNLDRTIAAAAADGDAPAVLEGAQLVREQLAGVLASYGLERLDAEDRVFDPAIHDAIAIAQVTPDRHQHVIEQIAPGYRFGPHLLRPAKVVVGRWDRGFR